MALLLDGKKFPPMLPRKLRVSRAKKQKDAFVDEKTSVYATQNSSNRRKSNSEATTSTWKAPKTLGRAGTAQVKREHGRGQASTPTRPLPSIFEGERATSGVGAKRRKRHSKPRRSERAAGFKRRRKLKGAT